MNNESLDGLEHLRRLLNGPVEDSLKQLQTDLAEKKVDAEEVSLLLPEAVRRSAAAGPRFAKAIGPTFSAAFQESVRRDPKSLADAVSPIMGPAIQGYIQRQIQSMVQSLNTALDHSLSPKGLRWRLEAWRTGKPFAEVVLLHTLVYRIELVMLIDPQSGLLMQSVANHTGDEDADLVSSLLTAIQDFMRESFAHRTNAGSELQEIQTNELLVWIQHAPKAVMAVAVRGEPPVALRQRIQRLLNRLHVDYGQLLSGFRGDTEPLAIVRPDLEELLESEFVGVKESVDSPKSDAAQQKPWWMQQLHWMLPAACLLVALTWGFYQQRANRLDRLADLLDLPPTAQLSIDGDVLRFVGTARSEWLEHAVNRRDRLPADYQLDFSNLERSDLTWVRYVAALRAQPGIAVVATKRNGDEYELFGIRDPNAVQPETIRQKVGLPAAMVVQHWDVVQFRE